MVRLKDVKNKDYKKQVLIFQFHYGTIKSICPVRFSRGSSNFNSTMVRLKDYYK